MGLRHNILSISPVDLQVNHANTRVTLSDVIRKRRMELKFTQENVALDVECDPATYNRWENNPGTIRLSELEKIAKVLQTTVVAMLRSVEEDAMDAMHEPMETYGLRAKVEAQDKQIELYRQLLEAKESLLEKYREEEKRTKKKA